MQIQDITVELEYICMSITNIILAAALTSAPAHSAGASVNADPGYNS